MYTITHTINSPCQRSSSQFTHSINPFQQPTHPINLLLHILSQHTLSTHPHISPSHPLFHSPSHPVPSPLPSQRLVKGYETKSRTRATTP